MDKAELPWETKHLIVLDHSHNITRLIVIHYHRRLIHAVVEYQLHTRKLLDTRPRGGGVLNRHSIFRHLDSRDITTRRKTHGLLLYLRSSLY